ncbi:MAG: regulatory iron-sulfur-containing complex subunit RicT [Flavobacteriales bacterium]|nr:regulatory iron-sulfur-containing complex subunit RicT [Flavobacteriales bacterium]MCW8913543.1 regulatory iron-sulfur-containing complex subunit RicT [Flavobacteriales bacterium]MCW8938622.1 regulatory iron-sulfur-containing complex subunit RicT [Flavobacteriales bacterium]MCW8969490.1 regulatory iron-sulfur-containing complex subunit RicT [Flavobacteriales bacterium]MCW8990616.1 regulatory iron-sulfur-containing complex subunit RicT [Flavobacteriales bacterium]
MGCSGCSTGRGCGTSSSGCSSKSGGCNKLNVTNWLNDIELPFGQEPFDCVEVRFKNNRKEFFRNTDKLSLNVGDVVAVEAASGHDIGTVSLAGELVKKQMRKHKVDLDSKEILKIYRLANDGDVKKWMTAQKREEDTMFKARTIAIAYGLQMKISDVEYQGDNSKAIFYYTAETRVDFRELIKKLAEEFKIRIEMKQIGVRQEASRLGGIGSCGRELCCSTWLTDFRSVSTSAARYQQLSLNPEKLAGQCGKLKCCLNYELDAYTDALKSFPDTSINLKTKKGEAFYRKMDIFSNTLWYSYKDDPVRFIEMKLDRVNEIIAMNKKNEFPEDLSMYMEIKEEVKKPDYENVVGQDSLTRFDKPKGNNNRNKNKRRKKGGKPNNQQRPNNKKE